MDHTLIEYELENTNSLTIYKLHNKLANKTHEGSIFMAL